METQTYMNKNARRVVYDVEGIYEIGEVRIKSELHLKCVRMKLK